MPEMDMEMTRGMEMPKSMSSPEPYYPNLYLHQEALPEATQWETGEEYTILIKVKKTGDNLRGDEKVSSSFDVLKCAVYNESEDFE